MARLRRRAAVSAGRISRFSRPADLFIQPISVSMIAIRKWGEPCTFRQKWTAFVRPR